MSDRDNPAPTLDSQNAQTKIDAGAPAPVDAEATLDSAPTAEPTPRRDLTSIGPYRLVKKLGEGGMGQVWLAEQTAPLQRQVALKQTLRKANSAERFLAMQRRGRRIASGSLETFLEERKRAEVAQCLGISVKT